MASDKKAEDIVVLEMKRLVNFCDHFVLCSATSDRHAKAIAEGIEDGLKDFGISVKLNRTLKDYTWIVLDTAVVVAHVFVKDLREFYNLEYLWREAKQLKWRK